MNEQFDPYRKWLGIPPEEQPPHHYRLLGLVPFESDPEVIATAADGRMALLKQFQNGPYSAQSQELLNQVAAARLCLLNPEKRAAYDAQLRKKLSNGAITAADGRAAPAMPEIKIDVSAAPRSTARRAGRAKPPAATSTERNDGTPSLAAKPAQGVFWLNRWAVGAGVLTIVGAIVLTVWVSSGRGSADRSARAEGVSATQVANAHGAPDKPIASKPPGSTNRKTKPSSATGDSRHDQADSVLAHASNGEGTPPTGPRTLEDLLDPAPSAATEMKPAESREPVENKKNEEDSPSKTADADSQTPKTATPADNRLPVPDTAAQQAAEKQIREVFKKEFAEAKTADERKALADTLLSHAHQSDNTPEQRFMLYRLAVGLLIDAGDYQKAFAAIDEMAVHFVISPLNVKFNLLDESVKNRSLDNGTAVFMAALPLVDAAIAADDFEMAQKLCRTAAAGARKSRDRQAEQTIGLREREIERQKVRYTAVQRALQTLAEEPHDTEANKTVGLWYCLTKRQWEKGLPYLAKSGDKRWVEPAQLELAGPTDPKDIVAAADAWWRTAERETVKVQRSAIEAHAISLYEKALPKLTGLEKTRVEKRIADAIAAGDESLQVGAGVIKPGNVALATNGTTVSSDRQIWGPTDLIDGVTQGYSAKKGGFAYSSYPCQWTITFDRVYRLQLIRMLLLDDVDRKYRYRLEVSADGVNFAPLVDYSQEDRSGWQEIKFPPRPVKAVRVIGLKHNLDPCFHVVEFEAYCVPPKN